MEDETLDTEVLNSDENLDSNQENEEVDVEVRLSKAEEIAKNQRIRAEKAEKELKALKANKSIEVEKETPKTESKKEQILEARALNSLHEDDIEEVIAIAEAKKISLSEAVRSPYVKSFLKEREEERKTAQATQTKQTGRATTKGSTEKIMEDFERGIVPDDPEEFAKARLASQKAKR